MQTDGNLGKAESNLISSRNWANMRISYREHKEIISNFNSWIQEDEIKAFPKSLRGSSKYRIIEKKKKDVETDDDKSNFERFQSVKVFSNLPLSSIFIDGHVNGAPEIVFL